MKKKIIITIISLFLTACLGVGGYFLYASKQGPAEIEDSEAQFQTTLLEAPKDGSKPMDHTIEENVAYALWTIEQTGEFKVTTTGTAVASVATQQIANERVVKDGKAMISTVSSGLVSTAKQRYFLKDKVLLRDADKVEGVTAQWKTTTPECVTYDVIKKRYGWLPTQATGYIICSDTYINKDQMTITPNGDGTYTISFDLNPDGEYAPFWYRREVLTNANSSIVPEFQAIHFEMTINDNWQILQNDISEQYKVKSMGVEAVTKTNCSDTFTYSDIEFDKASYDFFEQYADMTASDDASNTSVDPMSIIVESLQNADGSDKVLDLAITSSDFHVIGTASLNISDVDNIKVTLVLDDLYVEYTDAIYIAIGDLKVKTTVDDLTKSIGQITENLSLGQGESSFDVSQIMADLSQSTVSEDNGIVTVVTNLHLGPITLPIVFTISHTNDSYSLVSALADIEYNGMKLNLSLQNSSNTITKRDHSEFTDLAALDFIVKDISNILIDKKVDFTAKTKIKGLDIELMGTVSFMDKVSVGAQVVVSNSTDTLTVLVAYQEDTIYLGFENIKLKISKEDLEKIISKYAKTPAMGLDISNVLATVFSIDYDKLIKDVLIEEGSFDISLELSEIKDTLKKLSLSIQDEDEGLSFLVKYSDYTISLECGSLGYTAPILDDTEYQNLAYLTDVLENVLAIYNGKALEFDGVASYGDLKVTLSGVVLFEDALSLDADITISNGKKDASLHVLYLEDSIYLTLGNAHVSLSKEDLNKLLKEFDVKQNKMDLDSILDTLFTIDFHKLISSLVIDEDSLTVQMDISDFIKDLDDIKASITSDDSIHLDVKSSNILGQFEIKSTNKKVVLDDASYTNLSYITGFVSDILVLTKSDKLEFDATVKVSGADIVVNMILDIHDKDAIALSGIATITYDEKTITAHFACIDKKVYLSMGKVSFVCSIEDIKNLIQKYSTKDIEASFNLKDSIDFILSLDIDQMLSDFKLSEEECSLLLDLTGLSDKIGTVEVFLNRANDLKLNLKNKNLDVTVTARTTTKSCELYEAEYLDFMALDGVLKNAIDIYNQGAMSFVLDASYQDLKIEGYGIVDFSSLVTLDVNLSILYKGLSASSHIQYIDSELYLTLNNTKVMLTEDTIKLIMSSFTSGKSMDVASILDLILSIDFDAIFKNITLENSDLEFVMDLKSIKDTLGELTLSIKEDKGIKLDALMEKLALGLTLNSTDKTIAKVNKEEYHSLSSFVEDALELYSWIQKESIMLDIDGRATLKDTMITVNGSMEFLYKDSYSVYGKLHIMVGTTEHDVYVTYKEGMLYVSYGEIVLGVSMDTAKQTLKDALEILELDVSMDFDFSKLNPVIDSLIIKDKEMDITVSSLTELVTKITIAYSYVSDAGFSFDIKADDSISFTVDVMKMSYHDVVIPSTYLKESDILSVCKTVKNIIDCLKQKNFTLDLGVFVYDDGKKHLEFNGTLGLQLDYDKDEKFDITKQKMVLNLNILEFNKKESVKVTHKIHVLWNDGYMYIDYGNNDQKPSSKIRMYATQESILEMISSLAMVLDVNLDFVSDYASKALEYVDVTQLRKFISLNTKTKSNVVISDFIHGLSITDEGFDASIKASILAKKATNHLIRASLSSAVDVPLSLTVKGIYTDYVSEDEYTRIDVEKLEITNEIADFTAPNSLSGYYHVSELSSLVDALLVTGSKTNYYEISGTAKVNLPLIGDIDVPIYAKIEVLSDGKPLVYASFDLYDLPKLAEIVGLTKKKVYFYYQDSYIYIDRVDYDSTRYQLKVSQEEFFSDLMYYVLEFSFGMPPKIMNKINSSSSSNEDYVADAGAVLKSLSLKNTEYSFSIDLAALTGNSNLGVLDATVHSGPVGVKKTIDGVHTSNALLSISDISLTLVNVITIHADSISLTNLKEEDGAAWFTVLDMTNASSYIESYMYQTDMIYRNAQFYSKREHTVYFETEIGEKFMYTGASNTAILFPSYDVVEKDGKYYVFDGWYKDKYLEEEFTDTLIGEANVHVYAKWREITYYTLTIVAKDGTIKHTVYGTEELEKYLECGIVSIDGVSYRILGYSDSIDGMVMEFISMPEEDFTLYPVYEEVTFCIYMDDVYAMDLTSSTSLDYSSLIYLKTDFGYLGFKGSDLSYDILVLQYGEYAAMVDNKLALYLYTEVSSSDMYTITFDYDQKKFTDHPYVSISLPLQVDFDASYLPQGQYNHLSINYWYNDEVEYNLETIGLIEHKDQTLKAYYATNEYLVYAYDYSYETPLASVCGFTYTGSDKIKIILPKYVSIDGDLVVLQAIMRNKKDEEYSSPFTGVQNVSFIAFNDGFTTIGENAFKESSVLTVVFSETVSEVASDAFYMNKNETNAKNMRIYCSTEGVYTKNMMKNLCAYKAFVGHNYYVSNYKNTYQSYTGSSMDYVRTLI